MATPKKKHLVELMIEAGVKWPEGAEYAAQDKRDLHVWFYSEKPKFAGMDKGKWAGDVNYESGRRCLVVDGEKLNTICCDWHQTIVTREQYAEAVDAVKWHNPPSIEQLTADYHAKAAEADRLQAVADDALKAADDALLSLERAGELIGLVISIDTKPKPVAQPEITDWRDLRVGDVIWIGESNIGSNAPTGEYSIVETEIDKCVSGSKSFLQPVGIDCHHIHMGVQWPNLQYRKWRFVRRP